MGWQADLTGLDKHEPMCRFTGTAALLWEGLRSGVALDTTANDALWDSLFVSTAEEANLDAWGSDLDLARTSGESDPDYRARLLARLRSVPMVGTPAAVKGAVLTAVGIPSPGLTAFSDRINDRAILAPGAVVHPISRNARFGAVLFLKPGLDSTAQDAVVAELGKAAFIRDTIQLAEVDDGSVTPATLKGTASASSDDGVHTPDLAIDGVLGGPVGDNAFYWHPSDVPNDETPPWWAVELDSPMYANLLMIAQEPRANVNRLRRLRIAVVPPAVCQVDLGYSCELELYDVGDGDYNRHYLVLPRPTLVSELKIEALSSWNGADYHTLAEVELYAPSAWEQTWLRRLHLG